MFHPLVVAERRLALERELADVLPQGLREYSIDEVREFREQRFADLFDKKGARRRALTVEEQTFVLNEQVLGKIDYRYWAARYSTLNIGGQTLGTIVPFLGAQEVILSEIARVEHDHLASNHPDGVIFDLLKARQIGGTTLSISIGAHHTTTHGNIFALIASDVPDSTDFIWDMYERIYDHLPWYLRPAAVERVKNDEIAYTTGTRVFHGASKSTRGADKTKRNAADGAKGQLGRGKTLSFVHQSELATWTNPTQTDTSLAPAVVRSPFTFWMKESTAQGRGSRNWWHNEWQLAKSGRHPRAFAIFIPVFARKDLALPAPGGWAPSTETLTVARRYEDTGPRWMHKTVRATRDQLYWYERTRGEYEEKGILGDFFQEYPVDDDEAFQHSGSTVVLSAQMLDRLRNRSRPITSMIEVLPQRELTASTGARA